MRKLLLLITFFTVNCLFSQVKGKTEQSDNSILYSRVPDGGGVGGDDPIEIDPIDPDEGGTTATLFPPLSGLEAGVTPGELSVSSTGGAIYSIPIVLPPGINNVMPNISLNYNSQSGYGLAGLGWNIGGISKVTRIPSTLYHDGINDPVDFDDLDRFALDGQRLILDTGVYGQIGSTYVTEQFSNLKISYAVYNGVNSFKVEYPDGSISYYGLIVSTTSVNTEWPIFYWQNPQGIRINYAYSSTYIPGGGQIYTLNKIHYGTDTNIGINEIELIYKTKNRSENYFINGYEFLNDKVLSEIKIKGNNIAYKNYYLTHDLTSTGYERLISIQEKTGDNTKSLKPITFTYNVNQSVFPQNLNYSNKAGAFSYNRLNTTLISGDFTGNGDLEHLTDNSDYNLKRINENYEVESLLTQDGFPIGQRPLGPFNTLNSNLKLTNKNTFGVWYGGENIGGVWYNLFKIYTYDKLTNKFIVDFEKRVSRIYHPLQDDPTQTWENLRDTGFKQNYTFVGDFNGDKISDMVLVSTQNGSSQTQLIDLDRRLPIDSAFLSGIIDSGASNYTFSPDTFNGNLTITGSSVINQGDFDGDGKTDLFLFKGAPYNKIEVYSLINNTFTLINSTNYNLPGNIGDRFKRTDYTCGKTKFQIILSDFDGDGKSDILFPSLGKILISKSGSFVEELLPSSFIKSASPYTARYYTIDINNDGKADILRMNPLLEHQSTSSTIQVVAAQGTNGDLVYQFVTLNGYKYNYGLSINLYQQLNSTSQWENLNFSRIFKREFGGVDTDLSDNNKFHEVMFPVFNRRKNSQLYKNELAILGSDGISYFTFNRHLEEQSQLKNIRQGYGLERDIFYNNLKDGNGLFTTSDNLESFPLFNLLNSKEYKVVSEIRESFPGYLKKKLFKYQGAIFDVSGRGISGFQATSTTNWHNQPAQIISTVNKFDFSKKGAFVETFSKVGLLEPNYILLPSDSFISKTVNKYNHEDTSYVNPLLSNKVFKLFKTKTENFNGQNNTSSITAVNYNSSNNPINTTITVKNGGIVEKTSVVNFNYDAILSSPYIVDRLNSKTITTTLSSSGDVYTSEELYNYDINLLKELKKRTTNSGLTSDFITESNNFDAYGNLIQKKFSAPGMTDRIESYEYDTTTHRFLAKKINAELQETIYTVDQATGLVLSVKLPSNPNYPLTTSYNYDKWGKLIKTTDYLGKIETQTYSDISSGGSLITIYGSDGSSTKSISDPLGRVIHEGVKNFKNKWTVKSTEYNIYDQPVKIYKNYFDGDTPEVWDEMQYDIYGRLIQANHLKSISSQGKIVTYNYNGLITNENDGQKIKTILKNASGEIVSLQETPGENIIYEYFANGTLKKAITSGSTIEIQQDAFGRRKTLIDPSAGTRNYEYNKFGELTKEEVIGKGITEYDLDDKGKLLEKKITEMGSLKSKSTYTYNGNKLLSTIVFDDFANASQINYSYDYDDYKRLSFKDESGYQFYFQQAIHYDGFGRPEKELYTAINTADGKRSDKWVKHEYKFGSKIKVFDMLNINANGTLLWEVVDVNADGNITSAVFNDGNIKLNKTFDSYGFPTQIKYSNDISDYMVLDTEFDSIYGNLTKRTSNLFSTTWTEDLVYDQLDRLTDWKDHEGAQSQSYNGNGTINSNKIGNYAYTMHSKPFQVSSITPQFPSAIFDYYNNREQNITYDVNKKPLSITEQNAENIDFEYNPFSTRSVMYYGGLQPLKNDRPYQKYYSADGSMEIKRNILTNEVEFITYIGGSPYESSMVLKSDGTNQEYLYLLNDYQNTINGIVNENGSLIERRQFDVWGNLINFANAIGVTTVPTTANVMLLDRGYTSHEHLLGVNLINMNGRIYDSYLHKFLQPDNNIQDPYNSQNYNRYGYVLNNPTKYSDESGEFWGFIVGVLFNAYVSGYQSSGGEFNPLKWNSSSWTNAGLSSVSSSVSVISTNYSNNYIENYNSESSYSSVEYPNYSSFNTNNIQEHNFVSNYDNSAFGFATIASTALVADDVTGIGVVDDVLIPVVWAGAAAYWTIDNFPAIVGSAVGAYEYIEDSLDPGGFKYVTYTKTNSMGQVYVGRSSGYGTPEQIIRLRDSNHHMNSKGYGPASLSTVIPATLPGGYLSRLGDSSYWGIRGSEQKQIEHYRSLGISGNDRNGIGPNNREISKYLEWANTLFNF